MSLLHDTIGLITRRWPDLVATLEDLVPHAEVVWVNGVPRPTLRVDGIQLCGAVDPEGEAALQAARVPPHATRATVYEPAQGHLPRALLARPALRRLDVVLLAPAAFVAGMAEIDHRDWLADPRVTLRRARPDERPDVPWALAPAGLRLAEPQARHLRDHLILALSACYQHASSARWEDELRAALRDNAALIASAADAGDLAGRHAGARAIVVASGPSLTGELGWLAGQHDAVVICVNSAVRPLAAAGIVPHYVVAVDGHRALASHLTLPPPQQAAFAAVPLVFGVAVHGDALRVWPGPRFATRLRKPRYDAVEHPRGALWCEGTVTHAACDLARMLGARELVLLGADFSYPSGKAAADGAPAARALEDEGRRVRVSDGRGGDAPTDVNLMGYLRDLDDWLARNPGLRAQKRGRAGAAMLHAPWMDDDAG